MQQYFGIKKEDKILYLNDEDFNHIKNVMRMKEGTKLLVVYNSITYLCSLNKDLKSAVIVEKMGSKNENDIIAYIPILQEEKMSFVIEKGTELGITKFVPVEFENFKYKLKKDIIEKKIKRWNKIAKAAAEQSRRTIIPEVLYPCGVDNICSNSDVKLLCSLDKKSVKPISEVLTKNNVLDTISLVFGP